MAGLTGTQIKATYGDVMQCNHAGLGIDATLRIIQDGLGNNTALALSNAASGLGTPVTPTQAGDWVFNQSNVGNDFELQCQGVEFLRGKHAAGGVSFSQNAIIVTSTFEIQSNSDTGIKRAAGGVMQATNGAGGAGWYQSTAGEACLASPFTNATAALAATNLSWNVKAGRSYRIHGVLQVSNSTPGEGIQFNFAGGSATATTFFATATINGTAVAGTLTSTTLAGVINWTSITGTDYITINGFLKVNAAGTLTLQAAENTHATGTLTIGAGSWIALFDTVPL